MNQTPIVMDGTGRFPLQAQRGRTGYMSRIPPNLNIRPGILVFGSIGILLLGFAGIASFKNAAFLNSNNGSNLGVFYNVMGALFAVAVTIEIFGIYSVLVKKVPLVRLYYYLSCLVTVLVFVIYLIQEIVLKKFKNDLINFCINSTEGDHIFFPGYLGRVDGGVVTTSEAQEWCNQEYSHYSLSNIFALLFFTFIAAIFALSVFFYLRQLSNRNNTPATFPMNAYLPNDQTYNTHDTIPPYDPRTYNGYTTYNNDGSNIPLRPDDKPPNYEGNGRFDQKDYDSK